MINDPSMLSPVLLILWIRPHLLLQQILPLRILKVPKLYASIDGPRSCSNDHSKIKDTVSLLQNSLDWDCSLTLRVVEQNQGGSANAVFNAISWFFSHEEEGIILEDDCIPTEEFLIFSSDMLNRYQLDTRIGAICGYLGSSLPNPYGYSYFFSNYPNPWGWATWKRSWIDFALSMPYWDSLGSAVLTQTFRHSSEVRYWSKILSRQASSNPIDAWDYNYYYHMWTNNCLVVQPFVSLVRNVGFRDSPTHEFYGKIEIPFLDTTSFDPYNLRHPPILIKDCFLDYLIFRSEYGGLMLKIRYFYSKFLTRLRGLLRKSKSFYAGI